MTVFVRSQRGSVFSRGQDHLFEDVVCCNLLLIT